MSAIKVTIHGTGNGVCSLHEKEGDGITVSFDDGTVRESIAPPMPEPRGTACSEVFLPLR